MSALKRTASTILLGLLLAAVVPQRTAGLRAIQSGQPPAPPPPVRVPLELFKVPDGFEITVWAASPMLHNPTNIDIDRDGRIWVAEGVRYRSHHARQSNRRARRFKNIEPTTRFTRTATDRTTLADLVPSNHGRRVDLDVRRVLGGSQSRRIDITSKGNVQ